MNRDLKELLIGFSLSILFVAGMLRFFRWYDSRPERSFSTISLPGVGDYLCKYERIEQWGELEETCVKLPEELE